MPIDDIKDGQRVKCHNVYGTVVGKRGIPIGTLCWSKWTTALLLNSARTRCQSHRKLSAGRSGARRSAAGSDNDTH